MRDDSFQVFGSMHAFPQRIGGLSMIGADTAGVDIVGIRPGRQVGSGEIAAVSAADLLTGSALKMNSLAIPKIIVLLENNFKYVKHLIMNE